MRYNLVGVLYLGDIIILIITYFSLIKIFHGKLNLHPEALVCLSLPVVGIVWDLFNNVPLHDMFRGLARNLIFASSIVTGAICLLKFGFTKLWYMYVSVCISLLTWSIAYDPYVTTNLVILTKYYGGSHAFIALQTIFKKLPLLQIVVVCLSSAVCLLFLDWRGGALIWAATGLSVMGISIAGKLVLRRYILFHVIGIASLLLVFDILSYSNHPIITLRRGESARLRLDMTYHAWDGFMESPWLGNGSWNHARVYIDKNDPYLETGVHSYVFQLAYEYGIYGLVLGLLILYLLFKNFKSVLGMYVAGSLPFSNLFMLTYLYIYLVYGIVNSPFAGFSRIVIGMGIGILVTSGKTNRHLRD